MIQSHLTSKARELQQAQNLMICMSGLGGNKDHSVLISNRITDLNCLDAGTQCFPLHYYVETPNSLKIS